MPAYGSLDEVKVVLEANDNILTLTMEELRDAYGVKRLGIYVRQNISDQLQGRGIGHVPGKLPEYQEEYVRLYKLGSQEATLINAVLKPNPETDDHLRNALSGESEEIVRKIREMVC